MLIDDQWLRKHDKKVSQKQIDDQSIRTIINGVEYTEIKQGEKKGKVKKAMRAAKN
jgi:hypothetical protein